jgi:hypothetical protein
MPQDGYLLSQSVLQALPSALLLNSCLMFCVVNEIHSFVMPDLKKECICVKFCFMHQKCMTWSEQLLVTMPWENTEF